MALNYTFFLGGRDLEMVEIAALVRGACGAEAVVDKGLAWSEAKASSYRDEIGRALAANRRPVLVELRPDIEPDLIGRCLEIDHHGARAGAAQPTSLEQVFRLLDRPAEEWTRRLALVAANDRGWIPELREMGASPAEIAAIRREDRAAQGITAAEEEAGAAALRQAEHLLGGTLILVRLPHDRTAIVTDTFALEAEASSPPDVLILGPREINFSGRGDRVQALDRAFPGGWSGGALPDRGFWGHAAPLPALATVLAALD